MTSFISLVFTPWGCRSLMNAKAALRSVRNNRASTEESQSSEQSGGGERHDVRLSKALSKLLRHKAQEEGVKINKDGWAGLDDVLKYVNANLDTQYTPHDVNEMVKLNDKKRFDLREGPMGMQIRATRGHTMDGVSARNIGASLGEQKRLQLEQIALKARLAAEDIFDDESLLSRLMIRYKLPEVDMTWSRSAINEELLETTFANASFEVATFNPRHRSWKTVLKRGYGLFALAVFFMQLLYMIVVTPLNGKGARWRPWVAMAIACRRLPCEGMGELGAARRPAHGRGCPSCAQMASATSMPPCLIMPLCQILRLRLIMPPRLISPCPCMPSCCGAERPPAEARAIDSPRSFRSR